MESRVLVPSASKSPEAKEVSLVSVLEADPGERIGKLLVGYSIIVRKQSSDGSIRPTNPIFGIYVWWNGLAQ